MPRSRQLSAYLVVLCLVVAAACGGDDSDDDADPQPTTTSPDTTQSQEEEDEAALRQLAEDWYETYNEIFQSRSEGTEATAFLADPYLSQFRTQVEDYLSSGNQTTPDERSSQTIEEVVVDEDRAVVTECVVNANVLVNAEGEVVNDDVAVRRIETSAARTTDGWRFTERSVVEELEGERCDS